MRWIVARWLLVHDFNYASLCPNSFIYNCACIFFSHYLPQELDNIEVNIECEEGRSAGAGGSWGDTSLSQQQQLGATQCSVATTETAHSTTTTTTTTSGTSASTSAAVARIATSRDEHTKQRLALLVATLQNSARFALVLPLYCIQHLHCF